ncbi:Isochorismatase hydrolase [Mytilinidion resinicola]|uniref:Isochorismatase hydrolase n=1 Tax=Mytilinidion resinicola TaxID=574789 RepID=A0A6A6YUP3_9PEZI|nr:Isochorismatase hydrolase [Mytilinidion resinicola]KAF2811744.1 Isochorismatase hydrolase [Mytilinidion resinicola]
MADISPADYPEYTKNISNKSQPPLGFGTRPALIIVDAQKAYWNPDSPLYFSHYENAAAAPAYIKTLVSSARSGKCPVIWSRIQYENASLRDAGLWAKKRNHLDCFLSSDSRGLGDWIEGLGPEGDDVFITKKFASAFFGTTLATQLQMLNVDTLVICGAHTSGSIRQTTLDAMQSGFRPIVVAAACADRTRETHFANLFDIRAKMGDVIAVEEACKQLEKG